MMCICGLPTVITKDTWRILNLVPFDHNSDALQSASLVSERKLKYLLTAATPFVCSKVPHVSVILSIRGKNNKKVKVKVSHSLIAVGAVGVRVPLYLGHS